MPSAKDFGGLVREARTRQSLSVGRVADLVGRAPSTLKGWERGRAVPNDPSVLSALAAVLAIDERELFAAAGVDRPQDERVSRTLEQSLREITPPAMERSAREEGLIRHPAPQMPYDAAEPNRRDRTSDHSVDDTSTADRSIDERAPGSTVREAEPVRGSEPKDPATSNPVRPTPTVDPSPPQSTPQEQPVQPTIADPSSVDHDEETVVLAPSRPVITAPTPSVEAVERFRDEMDAVAHGSEERLNDPGVSELVAGWLARWSERRESSAAARAAEKAKAGELTPTSTASQRIPVTPAPYVQTAVVQPSYVEDAEERLTYRMRFLFTAVGMLIAAVALLWAAGEAWDAFGSVWDALLGGL